MAQSRSAFITSQLVMGLIILGLGILFSLDRLGFVEAGDILRLWPAALVIFGLMKLFQSRSTPGRFFGLILTAGGTLLLLDRLNYIDFSFSFGDLIVLVLIGLGIALIWSSVTSKKSGTLTLENTEDAESFINSFVFMGGINRKNTSKNFHGGELSAIMGGIEVDLTEAQIEGASAVINVFAFWGGIEIKIPRDWKVEIDGYPILGGIADETKSPQGENLKQLIIRGYAIMGGVEIGN
jgi:predicted membrane protein